METVGIIMAVLLGVGSLLIIAGLIAAAINAATGNVCVYDTHKPINISYGKALLKKKQELPNPMDTAIMVLITLTIAATLVAAAAYTNSPTWVVIITIVMAIGFIGTTIEETNKKKIPTAQMVADEALQYRNMPSGIDCPDCSSKYEMYWLDDSDCSSIREVGCASCGYETYVSL